MLHSFFSKFRKSGQKRQIRKQCDLKKEFRQILDVEKLEDRITPHTINGIPTTHEWLGTLVHDTFGTPSPRRGIPEWDFSQQWTGQGVAFPRPGTDANGDGATGDIILFSSPFLTDDNKDLPHIDTMSPNPTLWHPGAFGLEIGLRREFLTYNSWNDLDDLQLRQFQFDDNGLGFVIGGNPIILSGGPTGAIISTTYTGGIGNRPTPAGTNGNDNVTTQAIFDIPLLLTGSVQNIDIGANGNFFMDSPIDEAVSNPGDVGINKTGEGRLFWRIDNDFNGQVQVQDGVLDISADLALGDAVRGTIVQDGGTLYVSFADSPEPIEITGQGFDPTGGFGEPFGALSGRGGTLTGGVTLQGAEAFIGVDTSFAELIVDSFVTGGSSTTLTKVRPGQLTFTQDNTYNGETFVNNGTLIIENGGSLGSNVNDTTVNDGGTLAGRGIFISTAGEDLSISGEGVDNAGAWKVINFSSTTPPFTDVAWTGTVTLEADASVGGERNAVLTLNGLLSDNNVPPASGFALTKVGESTFALTNANVGFDGRTFVRDGNVHINNGLALGPAAGGDVTVNQSGSLQVEGIFTIGKDLFLSNLGFSGDGALQAVGANTDVEWTGEVTINATTTIAADADANLDISGTVGGAAGRSLQKLRDGTLVLSGTNDYLGPTVIRAGIIVANSNESLGGAGGAGTDVDVGATLQLGQNITLSGETLTLSGDGVDVGGPIGLGALHSPSGDNTWQGDINFVAAQNVQDVSVNIEQDSVTFDGEMSGPANVFYQGLGTKNLVGNIENTWTGNVTVNNGLLNLSKPADIKAIGGNLIIGDGISGAETDVVRLQNPNQIDDASDVEIRTSGLFDLNGFNEQINNLIMQGGRTTTGTGTLTIGGDVTSLPSNPPAVIDGSLFLAPASVHTFTIARDVTNAAGDMVINAVINGATQGSLVKDGIGVLRLNAQNQYPGATTINNGTILISVNNALPTATALTIGTNGTLDLDDFDQTVASLSGQGSVNLGTGDLTTGGDNSNSLFQGTFTGTGNLIKFGIGTLTLDRDNASYTGNILVNEGTVLVNNDFGSADVFVDPGATFGGTGEVNNVTVAAGSTVAPGVSPGQLNVNGNVDFAADSVFSVEINGTVVGTGHDQLDALGTVDITDAVLEVSTGFSPVGGTQFVIIAAAGGLTGEFDGLADGDTFVDSTGQSYRIDYTANSVILIALGDTSTSVVTDINPSQFGQNVTLTITVAADEPSATTDPTGTVDIFVDGNLFQAGVNLMVDGTPDGDAQATLTTPDLPGGDPILITAEYTGDANYATSLSPPFQQTVTKANTTSSITNDNTGNATEFGEPASFTVTVSSSTSSTVAPTGNVSFFDSGAPIGSAPLVDIGGGDAEATLIISTLSAGSTHVISGQYPGDDNYNGSSSGIVNHFVSLRDTITSDVTSSDNMTEFGEAVTFMVTVSADTPPASTVPPSGTVEFLDGATVIGVDLLDISGNASFTTTDLSVGAHSITARYLGNSNFNVSQSVNPFNQTVVPADTTTTVVGNPNPSVFGQPVDFVVTVTAPVSQNTPVGTVELFVDSISQGVQPVNANGQAFFQFTFTTLGAHPITANFTGNGNFTNSTDNDTQNVNPAPTTVGITSSRNPSLLGNSVVFTATVDAAPSQATPTGDVTFTLDGNLVGTFPVNGAGQAGFTAPNLGLGQHTVNATYTSNSPNFVDSGPTTFNQLVQKEYYVVGAEAGGGPRVKVFDVRTNQLLFDFFAYSPAFTGGVRVATGDVTGDGVPDIITGAGPGGGPHVKVFDGRNLNPVRDIFAFHPLFNGGVHVASGDINNDGFADVVISADAGGGPHVKWFDGRTGQEQGTFFAYSPAFGGGVRIATGDVNNDGFDDIITSPGVSGGPHIRAFSGKNLNNIIADFMAFNPLITIGFYVAAGDIDGDGDDDIIAGAGAGGGPHVTVFNAAGTQLASFFAFEPIFGGGVRVASVDLNQDGRSDLIAGAGPGGGPRVKIADALTTATLDDFFAFEITFPFGVYVGGGV